MSCKATKHSNTQTYRQTHTNFHNVREKIEKQNDIDHRHRWPLLLQLFDTFLSIQSRHNSHILVNRYHSSSRSSIRTSIACLRLQKHIIYYGYIKICRSSRLISSHHSHWNVSVCSPSDNSHRLRTPHYPAQSFPSIQSPHFTPSERQKYFNDYYRAIPLLCRR